MGTSNKQVVSLTPAGLDLDSDAKSARLGTLSAGDNVQAIRKADGGVEIRKRNGFSPLTRATLSGGTISKCVTGAAYKDELILCDGNELYSYSSVLGKWVGKGRLTTVAADITTISGDEPMIANDGVAIVETRPGSDIAYQSGLACYVSSFEGAADQLNFALTRIYIKDLTTGEIVASHQIEGEYKARVCGVGGAFFIFSCTSGVDPSAINARKIAATTPQTMSASVGVCADLGHPTLVFDARADVAHTKMWVAYRATTGQLTIKSWLTTNAAGVSSTYAARDPYYSIGICDWDYSNSRGYVAIAALAANADVRVIEFDIATGAETADTLIDSTGGVQIDQITGYRSAGGVVNLQWYENQIALGYQQNNTRGATGATTFTLMPAVIPAGRVFKSGAKWYLPVSIGRADQGDATRLLMLELDENTDGSAGTISICALLQNQDATGAIRAASCLGSVVATTGNKLLFSAPAILDVADVGQLTQMRYSLQSIELDFSGAGLGRPTEFNDVLHVPTAGHKFYDGKSVVECGFYADPLGLTVASDTATGGMTDGTYQYCTTVCRTDARGRLHRSAPSPVASVTLSGDTATTGTVYPFPFTDNNPAYNEDQNVTPLRLEVWRTEVDEDVFYLNKILTSDTLGISNFDDDMADAALVLNELLYTLSGELDNQKPPAVRALDVWGDRLWALTGESGGATWNSKKSAEGFGAEFSDAMRIVVDDRGGKPIDLCHVDATLALLKGEAAYLLQGDGPDDKGAGKFSDPLRMTADLGIVAVNARMSIDSGEMIQTPKGMFVLSRALSWDPIDGLGSHLNTMTIKGGTGLNSRHMAIAVTNDRVFVRDNIFGVWFTWLKSAAGLAGVACARWLNKAALFQADGTVQTEIEGQYFDGTSTAINEIVSFTYFCPRNARVHQLNFVGDWVASTTLSETMTFDYDSATAETKTKAVTAADKTALPVVPSRGRFNALTVTLQETSTTEGFRLSRIDIEWAPKSGLKKSGASKLFT